MSVNIPLDMQAEILKRLPVKPLVQFRSVSKPWKRLIDSPNFIVRHPQSDRFILRYQLHHHGEYKYITLVDNNDNLVQQDFVPTIPELFKKYIPRHAIRAVGSSHGLLCFNSLCGHSPNLTEMLVLWNPYIRKSVGIQLPYIHDDLPIPNLELVCSMNEFGFGVCPATMDPTILRIHKICYRKRMKDMTVRRVVWKVRVFTLSTRTWSILPTNLPRESINLFGSHIVIDRFVYWVAYETIDAADGQSQSHNYLIMSFDLTAKEFKEINLPDSLSNPFCKTRSISKLRKSLVVLAYHGTVAEDVCSLWMMMKERGVNSSFTKLYNINVPPDVTINRILGFRKTGELIMDTRQQNGEVQTYDPNSETITNFGIGGKDYSFFMCSYMETLLLVDQLDGFIYSINN